MDALIHLLVYLFVFVLWPVWVAVLGIVLFLVWSKLTTPTERPKCR